MKHWIRWLPGRADSTWSAAGMVEVAAYGEVVWSWHPDHRI
jgi:hypothetical protein